MDKIKYILLLAVFIISYSCEKELDSEGVSKTTTYFSYELTGGPLLTIPVGNPFVDPGFKAQQGTTDVTSNVKVTGSVDGMKIGYYVLRYSGTNTDGFSSFTERQVIIYDPTAPATDLTGDYLSNVRRVDPSRAFTGLDVSIKKLAPGFFQVSDFLGGFYDQGSNYNYGPDYAMGGFFKLNADNTISLVDSYNPGFADSLNDLLNGTYDPNTQTISWDAIYTSNNWTFKVTMSKVVE